MNTFNHFTFSALSTSIVTSFLGIFIIAKGWKRSKLYTIFGLYSFSIAWWSFCVSRFKPAFEDSTLIWGRLLHLGAIFIPVLFVHFVFLFIKDKRKYPIIFVYLIGCFFLAIDFLNSLLISGVTHKLEYSFPTPGSFYFMFFLFFISSVVYALIRLFIAHKSSSGLLRNQIAYLLWSSLFGYIGGLKNFLILVDFTPYPIYPYGTYFIPIYVMIVVYAIIKHRLMDIRIAITRITIFVLVYGLVLGLPFLVALKGLWLWALVLMSVLATIGPFVYTYLRERIEDILLKEQRHYQHDLRLFVREVAQIRNLDKLFETISKRVSHIISVDFLATYIFSKDSNAYVLRHKYLKKDYPFQKSIPASSALMQAFTQDKKVLFLELIGDSHFPDIPHETTAVSFYVNEGVFAFIILGPKVNKALYNQQDLEVFEILSGQASLAIENCLFWQEEKARLAREEQIRRQRAMDHFSASLAHEIDNPIYAIGGLAEVIKLTVTEDLKEYIPQDKVDFFNDRVGRLTKDITRISKMIRAIREFSGQTKGEFTTLALEQVIEDYLGIVEPQFKHEGILFNKEIEPGIQVMGNKIHLEEALINLATNSIHAVKNNNQKDKRIYLKVHKNSPHTVLIEFGDSGYGIKKELVDDIFLDFVTTKASTEGTGMGLARVRKIIENHKGKIWVESEGEGKGATFFMELPLLKGKV